MIEDTLLKILENATAMTIAALAILVMWKVMGQRTDPKLLEWGDNLTEMSAENNRMNAENNRIRDAGQERQTVALEKLTDALNHDNKGTEAIRNSIGELIQTLHQFIADVPVAHAQQNVAIGALKQSIEDHQGSVNTMSDTVDNSNGKIQEILDAVLELKMSVNDISQKFDAFKSESEKLSTDIENTKEKLGDIEQDIVQLQTPATKEVQTTPKIINLSKKEEDKNND